MTTTDKDDNVDNDDHGRIREKAKKVVHPPPSFQVRGVDLFIQQY